ncbi:MAG: DUF4406 domain-containing protein [Bacteroidales bacterium]|nr:DUF4406 domain-containing protein [Bacteroidales bacterium]
MRYDRVYIAGKITGDANYYAKFHAAQDQLQLEYGWNYWSIVNPVEMVPQGWPWWRCMVRCLRLVAGCKVVAMLPDWTQSRGARIEHEWAEFLGKEIIYLY